MKFHFLTPRLAKRTTRKWTIRRIIRFVWVTAGLSFIAWLIYSYQSHGVPPAFLRSDTLITVQQTGDYLAFRPTRPARNNRLIFYPGAMVDPKAYVPLCRNIALNGTEVILIKMPWRLATNGYNKPKELHMLDDAAKTYILAGHSQGAKMAAQFVYENPGLIDKLILIATTHPRDYTLSDSQIAVMKIYGSRDGVADETSVENNKSNLPATTKFVRITGGNHSQFGYYGFQFGDNTATISRERQQEETAKIISNFINDNVPD